MFCTFTLKPPIMHCKKLVFLTLFMLGIIQAGFAQFWKDVADVVTFPVKAPYQATVQILNGNNVANTVTDQFGRVIQSGSNIAQRTQSVFISVPDNIIRNTLGDNWLRGYQILTTNQRVQFELQATTGKYLGGCLQGNCSVVQLVAGPLAATLRDSYKVYSNYSAPLPPELTQTLSKVVPQYVLSQARWTIGDIKDFTVPGFLNSANTMNGGGHAVTIGNVMIFSRQLDLSEGGDWEWLLHEMHHISQYMRYSTNVFESIDGFAIDYVQNWGGLEQEAANNGHAQWQALQRK